MVSAHVLPCSIAVQCRTHHCQIQQSQTDTQLRGMLHLTCANNLSPTSEAPSCSTYNIRSGAFA